MVCGSLALEMRWIKRDMEEYVETAALRRRKIETEMEGLKRVVEGSAENGEEKTVVEKVKVEVVKKAVEGGGGVSSSEGGPRKGPVVIW
ncbi:hypothetical protein HK104_001434 [Borealophlyctis nickersoniae]|nr:hypothetical protein HK104_001434 [Borealophlyctis nickersoniae]